jgi:ABC-type antimicrobial peptide transport system permease subunit
MKLAAAELLVAVGAAAGCVLSWVAASSTVSVPPILEGEPWTTQVSYSAPLVALSLLLATIAGVLAVLAIARLRRN